MNFKENTWYNVNGEDYKCLTVVNTTVILMQFVTDKEPKIIKFTFDDIYNYKEITSLSFLVWSSYNQGDTQFMLEFAENFT